LAIAPFLLIFGYLMYKDRNKNKTPAATKTEPKPKS